MNFNSRQFNIIMHVRVRWAMCVSESDTKSKRLMPISLFSISNIHKMWINLFVEWNGQKFEKFTRASRSEREGETDRLNDLNTFGAHTMWIWYNVYLTSAGRTFTINIARIKIVILIHDYLLLFHQSKLKKIVDLKRLSPTTTANKKRTPHTHIISMRMNQTLYSEFGAF